MIKHDKTTSEYRVIPMYRRIECDLRDRITTGVWKPGTLLPSRRELADEYDVDLETLQRGIKVLLAEGLLEARPRRGTLVADRRTTGTAVDGELRQEGKVDLSDMTVCVMGSIPTEDRKPDPDHHWPTIVSGSLSRVLSTEIASLDIYGPVLDDATTLEELTQSIADAKRAGVGAIIGHLIYSSGANAENMARAMLAVDMPGVLITFEPLSLPVLQVYYDQQMAGYQAAQHMIRMGYRRIVAVAPMTMHWTEARLAGMAQAAMVNGLPADSLQVWPAVRPEPVDQVSGFGHQQYQLLSYQAMQSFDLESLRGGGVIGINDGVAIGVMNAAAEHGLSAGRDYGLMGFDDVASAAAFKMTSLRPPLVALGEQAAKLLLRSLRGRDEMTTQVRLRSQLIARALTAPGSRES